MIKVRVHGDVRFALKKLKKLIEKDGLLKEMKQHEYYEKPSEQRRRAKIRKEKAIKKFREEEAEKNKKSL